MANQEYLIRYISLGKLIELLNSKTLHLGRIDLFEDKTEGEWYAHLARAANKAFSEYNPSESEQTHNAAKNNSSHPLSEIVSLEDLEKSDEQLIDEIRSLKQRSYISSWFASDYLSIAMWKLYGLTDEGIAIRVKKEAFEKLKEINQHHLNEQNAEVLYSNVIYVEDNATEMKHLISQNISNKEWIKFRNLLLKHKAYKFEEEYRLSVILPDGQEEYPLGIKLSIGEDLNAFIDSIYLNPLIHSEHWYIKVMEKMLEVFGLEYDKLRLGEIKTDFT